MKLEAKKRLHASREDVTKKYSNIFKQLSAEVDKHMHEVAAIMRADSENSVPFTEIRPVVEAANELKLAIEDVNKRFGHHVHSSVGNVTAELLEN